MSLMDPSDPIMVILDWDYDERDVNPFVLRYKVNGETVQTSSWDYDYSGSDDDSDFKTQGMGLIPIDALGDFQL
ncbi:MAG: hypothetical protein SGARI_006330, partial [Bacillariaceae sp.]